MSVIVQVSDFGLAREANFNLEGGKFPIKWTAPEALKHGVSVLCGLGGVEWGVVRRGVMGWGGVWSGGMQMGCDQEGCDGVWLGVVRRGVVWCGQEGCDGVW